MPPRPSARVAYPTLSREEELRYFQQLYDYRQEICDLLSLPSPYHFHIQDLTKAYKEQRPTDQAARALCQKILELEKRLVQANIRLAYRICYNSEFEKIRSSETIEDMKQTAILGLYPAVSKYKHDQGVPFANYASFWIRKYVYQFTMPEQKYVPIGELEDADLEFKENLYTVTDTVRARKNKRSIRDTTKTGTFITDEKTVSKISERQTFDAILDFLLGDVEQKKRELEAWADIYEENRTNHNRTQYQKACREYVRSFRTVIIVTARQNIPTPYYPCNGTPIKVADLARFFSVTVNRIYQIETDILFSLRKKFANHVRFA